MQTTGYIIINNKKLLILVRTKKYSKLLKLRKSGKDGGNFIDEGHFLEEEPVLLKKLLDGFTIEV